MTANVTPPSEPASCSARMFGCDSAATAFASRSKRASRSGSLRHGFRKNLDGDVPIEARIARAIDLAHSACPERVEDFVTAQAAAGGGCHEVGVSLAATGFRGSGAGFRGSDAFRRSTGFRGSGVPGFRGSRCRWRRGDAVTPAVKRRHGLRRGQRPVETAEPWHFGTPESRRTIRNSGTSEPRTGTSEPSALFTVLDSNFTPPDR